MFRLSLPALMVVSIAGSVFSQTFARKPFLQKGSPTNASVCWRVTPAAVLTVHYSTDSTNLNLISAASANVTDACADITGLQPFTKYFYEVYAGNTRIAGSTNQFFKTHPVFGSRQKHSFWIIGDAGLNSPEQLAVRDAYITVNGGTHSDGLIMLGDNAYQNGTDAELTTELFNIYPTIMANTFTWSCIGNHESYTASGAPYLAAFYFPTAGQSGGVASGTELYYSYDYGNVHFISLASIVSSRAVGSPQYNWLVQDLQATTQDWIIVFFHHPPYTWGSHNSDLEIEHIEMRNNFLPLLEQYGVDLVYGGHSHDYERSFLADSAYGLASDNLAKRARVVLDARSGNPTTTGPYIKNSRTAGHRGTVYTVDGSSGQVSAIIGLHPMHYIQLAEAGSVILTVQDSVATHKFYNQAGVLRDQFQLIQPGNPTRVLHESRIPSEFNRTGRALRFNAANQIRFHLYTPEGRVIYSAVPRGALELNRTEIPDGEYFFRYGTAYGKISLP